MAILELDDKDTTCFENSHKNPKLQVGLRYYLSGPVTIMIGKLVQSPLLEKHHLAEQILFRVLNLLLLLISLAKQN